MLLRKLTWLLKNSPPEIVADSILRLKDNLNTLPLELLVTAYCAVKYDGDRVVINKKGKPYTIGKRESLDNVSAILEAIDTFVHKMPLN